MVNIENKLKSIRSDLSCSTIKNYSMALRKFHNILYGEIPIKISNFKDSEKMIDELNKIDLRIGYKKNIVSGLLVLYPKDINYKQYILKLIEMKNIEDDLVKDDVKLLDKDEINKIINKLKNRFYELYIKKLKIEQIIELQDYLILCLYTMIPPRRLLDYVEMKIKNINKDTDNYYDNKKFYFNKYKTSKTHGKQIINIPDELDIIIKKYFDCLERNNIDTDYLLFNTKKQKLSVSLLNIRLKNLIGGSVNSLRHTYLTNNYKDMVDKYKIAKTDMSDNMGSSINQIKYYVK